MARISLWFWLLSSALAHAGPTEQALTLQDKGIVEYRLGQYEEARASFSQAAALLPDKPNPHRWLTLSLIKLGHCEEARVEAHEFYLRISGKDPRRTELESLLALCKPKKDSPPAPVLPPSPQSSSPTVIEAKKSAPAREPSRPRIAVVLGATFGAIGVVAVALGVGLGLGLSDPNPHPSLGTISPQATP